jgi:hypothetical protein
MARFLNEKQDVFFSSESCEHDCNNSEQCHVRYGLSNYSMSFLCLEEAIDAYIYSEIVVLLSNNNNNSSSVHSVVYEC